MDGLRLLRNQGPSDYVNFPLNAVLIFNVSLIIETTQQSALCIRCGTRSGSNDTNKRMYIAERFA